MTAAPARPCTGTTATGTACENTTTHPTRWCGQCARPPAALAAYAPTDAAAVAAAGPGPDPLNPTAGGPVAAPRSQGEITADALRDLTGVWLTGTHNDWAGQLASCDSCGCLLAFEDNTYVDRWAAGGNCEERACPCHTIPRELPESLIEAADPATDPQRLVELTDSGERLVAYRAAANPAMPPERLARLAYSADSSVRRGAARNPASVGAALERLAADVDPDVVSAVGENPSAPDAALAVIAATDRWADAAAHLNAGPATVAALAGNPERPSARQAAAARRDCPPEVLARLAGDSERTVRDTAAANPKCPPAARSAAGLLND